MLGMTPRHGVPRTCGKDGRYQTRFMLLITMAAQSDRLTANVSCPASLTISMVI